MFCLLTKLGTVKRVLFLDFVLAGFASYIVVPPAARKVRNRIRLLDSESKAAKLWLKDYLEKETILVVKSTRWNSAGDKLIFALEDGTLVKIYCFWPRPVAVSALLKATYKSSIGWVFDAIAPNNDRVSFHAWQVFVKATKA